MITSEYAKIKLKSIFRDNVLEEMCREMCKVDKVDPDMVAVGLGFTMPAGEFYPLWKARMRFAEVLFDKFCTIEEE